MSKPLIRKAFVMQVNPDSHAEYKKRHDEIWPELIEILKAHGGHNYSIFLEPNTHQLFGYVEIESEQAWNEVAKTDTCQRWWAYMADIMKTNDDNSPCSTEINEVFHLD